MGKVKSERQIKQQGAVQTTRKLGKPREYHFLGVGFKKRGLFLFVLIFAIILSIIWVIAHSLSLMILQDEGLALTAAIIILVLVFDELLVIMVFVLTLWFIIKRRRKRKKRQNKKK